jgi:enoyl-CoA hydratase/carnithine racemase
VLVLTGEGRAVSAGADLKERAAAGSFVGSGAGTGSVGSLLRGDVSPSGLLGRLPKPSIAAINGIALGGGLELALACDMRIASESATFGLPEITRGFFPGGGGPQRLPRMVPRAAAMEMLFTGEHVDARTALDWGIVSRVLPPEDLMPRAREMAAKIASYAPLALRALKEVAATADTQPLDEALRLGAALRWIVGQTEDSKEGPRAFAEKRPPQYRGE